MCLTFLSLLKLRIPISSTRLSLIHGFLAIVISTNPWSSFALMIPNNDYLYPSPKPLLSMVPTAPSRLAQEAICKLFNFSVTPSIARFSGGVEAKSARKGRGRRAVAGREREKSCEKQGQAC